MLTWLQRLFTGRHAELLAAANASDLHKVIAKRCCEYDDGSGDVDGNAVRSLLGGLTVNTMIPALLNSGLNDLAKLIKLLRTISEKIGAGGGAGAGELQLAACGAIKSALPRGTDAGDIRAAIAAVCCEYDDVSGEVYRKPSVELFESFDTHVLMPILKGSGLRDLNMLSILLERLSEKLGLPRCEGLERLRPVVSTAVQRAVRHSGQELARARNAEDIRKVITACCCEYDDGSGAVSGEGIAGLFAGFDQAAASAVSPALIGSDLKSVTALLATVRRINDRAPRTEKGWAGFQMLVVKACRAALRRAESVEDLREAVATACLQYDDGSGKVYAKAAKVLFDGLDPSPLDKVLRRDEPRALSRLSHALELITQAVGPDAARDADSFRARVDQAAQAALRALKASIPAARDADALRTALTECCRHDDGSGEVYEPALRFVFDGLDPAPQAKALSGSSLNSLGQLARALQRMADRLHSPCAGLHEWRMAVAKATQPALAGARDAEELCESITAACCEYSDGSGDVYPDLARSLFDGLVGNQFIERIMAGGSGVRNRLTGILDQVSKSVGQPPCRGLEGLQSLMRAVSAGPEAIALAMVANCSSAIPHRMRLMQVAKGETAGVFEQVRVTTGWPERVAGLLGEDDPAPQLWLRCAKVSMADAILALRSEATDAYVCGLPRLVEDADGSAGIEFRLKDGRQILPLVKELLSGDYGPDKPVITNGAACGMPSGDDKQLVRLLGLKEALGIGSVMSW